VALPASLPIHGVQLASLFDRMDVELIAGQQVVPTAAAEVDSEEEYQVSSVEDTQMLLDLLEYCI